MSALAADDRRLLAELAARYAPAVRAYFARRLNQSADAEDLTQEVFSRLLGRASLSDIAHVEGYLFQVAANVLRDRFRRAGRKVPIASDVDWDADPVDYEDLSPERVLLGKEAYARMTQALMALPERTRTIVVLNRFENMSARDIARRLGISISLVEKEMMRATATLRDSVR